MKLFPLEIELPQVIHGRYSQSKLVELERQRWGIYFLITISTYNDNILAIAKS